MPLQATSGAASYDGFGGGVAVVPNYIEDVFSTWLYTSDGTTQTITNGIDLSTYGGLVWIKNRSAAQNHYLSTTTLGIQNTLTSNNTGGLGVGSDIVHTVTTTGFTAPYNFNIGENLASWTFRKQPKFFDVVTYTGNGAASRSISHSLGAVPGFIIVKATSATGNWAVWHRSTDALQGYLNTTAAFSGAVQNFASQTSSTTFDIYGPGFGGIVNDTGVTYVAYLFAHDAGGFGLTGTDNVISCGVVTASSGNVSATLGYEPQFILYKGASTTGDWRLYDSMRGMTADKEDAVLFASNANAESNETRIAPNATGFTGSGYVSGATYIYITIRRGPMKVPTLGTSVLELQNLDNLSVNTLVSSTVVPDMALHVHNLGGRYVVSRLTGGINTASSSSTSPRRWMLTSDTSAEDTGTTGLYYEMQNASFRLAGNGADPGSSLNLAYFFRRAPGFFDEVCDSGTGGTKTITHNLGVAPELWFRKRRDSATYGNWYTYTSALGNTKYLILETTAAQATATADVWNLTTPTATTLYVGGDINLLGGGAATYVNYLFATCAGVSKVGSYTGTATTKQIDCGFTGGARFVLIKRTDSTGDWYVWDSARGIVAGNDPYLLLNSTAAEVTSTDYVDTYSAGFEISSTAPAAINASGGSFIFLAIA